MYCQWELEFIANCFFAPIPFGPRPHVSAALAYRICLADVHHNAAHHRSRILDTILDTSVPIEFIERKLSEDHKRSFAKKRSTHFHGIFFFELTLLPLLDLTEE